MKAKKFHLCLLADANVIRVADPDFRRYDQVGLFRHDVHQRLSRRDHAADGENGKADHLSGHRRPNPQPLQLVAGGPILRQHFAKREFDLTEFGRRALAVGLLGFDLAQAAAAGRR